MKKRGYFLGLILAMLLFLPMSVMAECSYEDQVRLSSEAANVKFSYEIVEATSEEELKEYEYPLGDYVIFTVMNVTENLQIHLVDEWGNCGEDCLHTGIDEIVSYDMTNDGMYSLEINDVGSRTVRFTVTSSNSSCNSKEERAGNVKIPGFNKYSLLEECVGSKEYYCEKYPSLSVDMTKQQVLEKLKTESSTEVLPEDNSQTFFQRFGSIILICVGVIILGVGVVIVIRIIMKKRSNVK